MSAPHSYHSETSAPDAIPCPWCGCDEMKVYSFGRENEARTYYVGCSYDRCDGNGIEGPRRSSVHDAVVAYNQGLTRAALVH